MARVILACRVSFDRKENTSVERQDAKLLEWAAAEEHEVVDRVHDRAVSGDVDMFDRPKLGCKGVIVRQVVIEALTSNLIYIALTILFYFRARSSLALGERAPK